jgi:putative ABC transport system substrate-binding protein
MVTGLTNLPGELSSKYLELLLAAVPKLKRVGFLFDPNNQFSRTDHLETARRALKHYRVDGRFAQASKPEELQTALARLAKEDIQGLVLMPSTWLAVDRFNVAKLAIAHRWPVVAGPQSFAEAGTLLSYSPDALALCRRAAYHVDRILKGAKPGDLPIEQPTTFELTLNVKTAKALGLTMPPEIMVRATRVIE